MENIEQVYKCQWFQYSNGRYLSANESFNGIATCVANDLESAIEIFKERENADSEISFTSRVSVWAEVPTIFYRIKYGHFSMAKEDYSRKEWAFKRVEQMQAYKPFVFEVVEICNPLISTSLDYLLPDYNRPGMSIHIKDMHTTTLTTKQNG